MTGPDPAAVLACALKNNGTDLIFGVPGGGPNLDVIGATDQQGIRFVLAHAETAACIMASVYGYLSGRLSAAVVTRGPGAASAVNGAAQATLDRHPLVLITDTVPSASAARVPHQRLDQRAMFTPVTKASCTLGANTDETVLTGLLASAMSAPAGTIHLDYDAGGLDEQPHESTPEIAEATRSADGAKIAQLVASASKPLVVLGLGATQMGQDLVVILESFGAPVFTTYQGIGAIPTEHHLAAGLFTNGASERALMSQADLIIGIGLDPIEPIPAPWRYDGLYVSLAEYPTTDPYFPIEAEAVGSLASLVPVALRPTNHDWHSDAGATNRNAIRQRLEAQPHKDAPPNRQTGDRSKLNPIELVQTIANHIPDRLTATVDAGAHFLAVMPFWPTDEAKRLVISNGLATMGYAVPAAIAAALARPDEPVVCFVGDGGLGMTLAELETIGRLGLPITVVVFNDSSLSLIRIKQRHGHGGADAVSYRPTDFAAMAPSFGLEGVAIDSKDTLEATLEGAWDHPRLLDVQIDPSHYQHLISVTRG